MNSFGGVSIGHLLPYSHRENLPPPCPSPAGGGNVGPRLARDRALAVHFYSRFSSICGIFHPMKKSLLETNPYLKDPAERKRLLRRSLVSSFAIEGIYLNDQTAESVKEGQQSFTVRKHQASSR